MSEQSPDYFDDGRSNKHFHQVIALHDYPELSWDKVSSLAPMLPRGWWELAQLNVEDRIEFTHKYWQSQLSFMTSESIHFERRLNEFFDTLDEIGIYVTQLKKGGSFDVHMAYSLKEATGFFQGSPPASEETLELLKKKFGFINFPQDYIGFLHIHDGFSKYADTGMIKSRDIAQIYQRLQHLLAHEVLIRPDGHVIDPENLIPFYESFGLHCYQCFYTDWYPEKEMGNVFFSENDRSISNFLDRLNLEDNLAFPTFVSWLIFYLEDIWHL